MITLERLLKHMAWSNQAVLRFLTELPDEALDAYVVKPEWNVSEISGHIVSSSDWYVYRLTGREAMTIERPRSMADVQNLIPLAASFDASLLEEAVHADRQMTFKRESGDLQRWRSTILSQAVHHATEHRAQLACALEAKGFAAPDLDELDLWSYEAREG